MIKKNRLVWKHCVQIQTLTSLCKNSTRNLYGICYRPCFKSCRKRSVFFGQVALFSQTITHVMFCSLFSICPRYYDKMGKLCGDCRRNLMVVLHKLKILNGVVIPGPSQFL